MADDQLSESTESITLTEPPSNGIKLQPDPDQRPFGRCYPEQLVVRGLLDRMRELEAQLKAAVSVWGDCRQRAAATAAATSAAKGAVADFASDLKDLSSALKTFDEDIVIHFNDDCTIAPDDQSESLPLADETP